MITRAEFQPRATQAIGDTPPRTIRIALLGCGTVGGATARLLSAQRCSIREMHGVDPLVTRILVRDGSRPRDGIDASLLTASIDDVFASWPDLIIEALGGREPASRFIERALERGISVVSANKTAIAHDGPRLRAIADRAGARLACEASVGAAVPILAALRQRGAAGCDPVTSLRAVVNGTCNYILSRMRETGRPLHEMLADAISSGLAEPDPAADISGRDSAEKLCILTHALGLGGIRPADIETTGIEHITPRDLDAAREHGCVVRLVAELDSDNAGRGVRARVGPMFVPLAHPLAKARGAENVFVIQQQHSGRLVLHGEGAGPAPTAAAILGDVLNLVQAPASNALSSSSALTFRQTSAPVGRTFVRVPHGHDSAERLRRIAKNVHVRRDAIEAMVDIQASITIDGGFAAPLLT